MKICSVCHKEKDLSFFPKSKAVKCGYSARCKQCSSEYNSERYKKKAKEIAEYQRDYYNKNKLYVNDRQKKYIEKNLEKTKKYQREYQKENKSQANQRSREWYKNNKERVREYWKENVLSKRVKDSKRRAKKKGCDVSFTKKDVEILLKLQKQKCVACLSYLHKYHIDHIIPLARGGDNSNKNIQILCPSCNQSKGAKMPTDFMRSRGFLL